MQFNSIAYFKFFLNKLLKNNIFKQIQIIQINVSAYKVFFSDNINVIIPPNKHMISYPIERIISSNTYYRGDVNRGDVFNSYQKSVQQVITKYYKEKKKVFQSKDCSRTEPSYQIPRSENPANHSNKSAQKTFSPHSTRLYRTSLQIMISSLIRNKQLQNQSYQTYISAHVNLYKIMY